MTTDEAIATVRALLEIEHNLRSAYPNQTAYVRAPGEALDALAWEIWAWPDLDDFEGLIVHLLRCGYSITAIGATRLDAAIDEACAQRKADTFTTLGEAAASVVSRVIPST